MLIDQAVNQFFVACFGMLVVFCLVLVDNGEFVYQSVGGKFDNFLNDPCEPGDFPGGGLREGGVSSSVRIGVRVRGSSEGVGHREMQESNCIARQCRLAAVALP